MLDSSGELPSNLQESCAAVLGEATIPGIHILGEPEEDGLAGPRTVPIVVVQQGFHGPGVP